MLRKSYLAKVFLFGSLITMGGLSVFPLSFLGASPVAPFDLWIAMSSLILAPLLLSTPRSQCIGLWQMPSLSLLAILLFSGVIPIYGVLINEAAVTNLVSVPRYLSLAVFFVFLTVLFKESLSFENILTRSLLIITLLNAIYCTLQIGDAFMGMAGEFLIHRDFENLVDNPKYDVAKRPTGLFRASNELGLFFVLVSMYFISTIIYNGVSLLSAFGASLSIILVLVSNSKTAGATLLLTALIVFLSEIRNGRVLVRYFFLSAVGLILGVFIWNWIPGDTYLTRQAKLIEVAGEGLLADSSFRARVEVAWPAALSAIARFPLGFGGAAAEATGRAVDSGYLGTIVRGGPLLLLLVILHFVTVLRSSRMSPSKDDRHYAVMAKAGVIVSMISYASLTSLFGYLSFTILYICLVTNLVLRRKENVHNVGRIGLRSITRTTRQAN